MFHPETTPHTTACYPQNGKTAIVESENKADYKPTAAPGLLVSTRRFVLDSYFVDRSFFASPS